LIFGLFQLSKAAPSLAIIAPEELRRELLDHADPNQEGALIAARSIASEGREPTHLSRFRRRSAMPEMGHGPALRLTEASGRCRPGQATFAGTDGKGREAPLADRRPTRTTQAKRRISARRRGHGRL
jgi:hypothetical protein